MYEALATICALAIVFLLSIGWWGGFLVALAALALVLIAWHQAEERTR